MRMGTIESVKRATLTLDEFKIRALHDALSYYNTCANNNFDAGYERGNEMDKELKRDHKAARDIEAAVAALVDQMNEEDY